MDDTIELVDKGNDELSLPDFEPPTLDDLRSMSEYHSLDADELFPDYLEDEAVEERKEEAEEAPQSQQESEKTDTDSDGLASAMNAATLTSDEEASKHVEDSKAQIKLEFSCEPEEFIEHDFDDDFFVEDLTYDDDDDEVLQVEVYSTRITPKLEHIERDKEEDDAVAIEEKRADTSLAEENVEGGKVSELDTLLETEQKSSETTEDGAEDKQGDNLDLFSIMSDHNYTTQEQNAHIDTLRANLTNHILNKNINSSQEQANVNNNKDVSEFVENILKSISAFQQEKNKKPNENKQVDDFHYDEDSFVQNIMDAVVAEDAAEEEEADRLSQSLDKVEKQANSETTVKVEQEIQVDEMPTEKVETAAKQIEGACFATTTTTADDDKTSAEAVERAVTMTTDENLASPQTSTHLEPESGAENESDSFKVPLPASPMLPDNCSEPMEHSTLDEAFETLIKPTTGGQGQLHELRAFAKNMLDDCTAFAATTGSIGDKLQKYVLEKMQTLRTIANIECFSKECQTETRNSRRDLKKLNRKNKRDLLTSTTDSSDSNDSSTTEEFPLVDFKKTPKRVKSHRISIKTELTEGVVTQHTNDDYDDGVPLTKYIQSEIFEIDTISNHSSNTRHHSDSEKQSEVFESAGNDDESDKENVAGDGDEKKRRSNGKRNTSELDEEDEKDKEIDRLTNLSGLSKRQSYTGSTKNSTKAKSQVSKTKRDILDFSDDDVALSDESMSQSEEEIITEKQYLARHNENLKQQLLNESSSDSEEADLSDGLDEVLSDEDGGKPPLVDKFLKTFNVEDSDEEPVTPQEDNGAPLSNGESSGAAKGDKSAEQKQDVNSPDNSDCELLNDSSLFRKRGRPKSLEKMLSEADKRKKINRIDEDLISVSSESEGGGGGSDVEATEEPKSRILKPMLRQDQLAGETRKAQKHENDRIRRLEKKHTMLAKVMKERISDINNGDLILDYHEETQTFIKVHPAIVKQLKKHQIDGVKFMYDSCYGGLDALKKSDGSGCILAHCMGLGKTLQLIALLHTVISYKVLKTTKILVLCPKSTVMNWADEIVRWLGPVNARNLKVYAFNDQSDINEKISVLREWSQSSPNKAGCLLIGYEAFRTLVFYHSYKNRGNVSTARLEDIRDKVDKYLLQPGADLVVCDEGHIIKNSKSAISLAVAKIVTPKRIILTGTPIQNNLKEYYSMVNFIKPLFLGTEKEFANLYANPIKNGQHKDSNKKDIKVMKQRSFVLHKKLSKFVQRKEAELLKSFLPQKYEYVLFIPMTTVQNNLYEYILDSVVKRDDNRGKSLITDYTCLRKIWTHPKVLEDAWKNATVLKNKKDMMRKNQLPHSDDDQPDDIYDSQTGIMSVTNDWWRHLLTEKDLETVMSSNKLRTMFEILRMCEDKGEKCLIFSAFVAVLNVVEYFFKKINTSDPETLKEFNMTPGKHQWVSGHDYYRLDGKTPKSMRHAMVKSFNSAANKRARVFLISAKAGGQGINLTGANRVIILDTSWNPSNDQQNIFRIFRLGQKKNCYIYRLLAMGTMEEKVYSRSVTKQAMSFRVVDEQQIDRHYSMAELAELYTLTIPNYAERRMPHLPMDNILADLLLNFPDLVYRYHEHDSLLENKVEQELSEQEKADAWAAYEKDLQQNTEVPNMDGLQNMANAGRMNYLSSMTGFDFQQIQSLLNYGSLGQSSPLSPYLQSFFSQYNYPTQNQQYLEMYKRLTQGYSDMNAVASGMSDHPAYNMPTSSMYAPNSAPKPNNPNASALLSGVHGSGGLGAPSNPLSALGDLSLYGMAAGAAPKPMSHVGASSPMNMPPPTLSGHTPEAMYAAATAAANMPPTSMHSSFGQYQKSLESAFPNFYNYARNDYPSTSTSGANANKAKNNAMHLSQYMNTPITATGSSSYGLPQQGPPAPAPAPPPAVPVNNQTQASMQAAELNKKLQQQQAQPSPPPPPVAALVDKRKTLASDGIPMSVIRKSDAVVTNSAKNNMPGGALGAVGGSGMAQKRVGNLQPIAAKPQAVSAAANSGAKQTPKTSYDAATRALNLYTSNNAKAPATKTSGGPTPNNSSPLNMGIFYPQATAKSSATDILKSNNEMQIIPTTNPPGTASISKQFNEISPSISLTAVRSTSSTKATTPSQLVVKNTAQNIGKNNNNSNSNVSSNVSSNNTKVNKTPHINKRPPMVAVNPQAMKQASTTSATSSTAAVAPIPNSVAYTTASASAKTAAAAAVVAKAANSTTASITALKTKPLATAALQQKSASSIGGTTMQKSVTSIGGTTMQKSVSSIGGTTMQKSVTSIGGTTMQQQKSAASIGSASMQQQKSATNAATLLKQKMASSAPPAAGQKGAATNATPTPVRYSGSAAASIADAIKRNMPQARKSQAQISAIQQSNSNTRTSSPITTAASSTSANNVSANALFGSGGGSNAAGIGAARTLTKVVPKSNLTAFSPTPVQLHKRPTSLLQQTTASASTAANTSAAVALAKAASIAAKNPVNIRPIENKQSPAGTGVYIIETKINQKKLAIGAPTKSGGGTTVTKVPPTLQRKRKLQDPLSKDIGFHEAKRQK